MAANLSKRVTHYLKTDRAGQVMDPFGYKWMITTHKEDVGFKEMQKRSDKIFSKQPAMNN